MTTVADGKIHPQRPCSQFDELRSMRQPRPPPPLQPMARLAATWPNVARPVEARRIQALVPRRWAVGSFELRQLTEARRFGQQLAHLQRRRSVAARGCCCCCCEWRRVEQRHSERTLKGCLRTRMGGSDAANSDARRSRPPPERKSEAHCFLPPPRTSRLPRVQLGAASGHPRAEETATADQPCPCRPKTADARQMPPLPPWEWGR